MKKRILFVAMVWASSAFAEGQGFGPIGPSLLVGAPHPFNLAVDSKYGGNLSFGLVAGTFGLSVPISGITAKVGLTNADARFRWHPYSGSLFLGGMFGMQSLSVSASQTVSLTTPIAVSVPINLSLTTRTYYFTPHLGWFWIFGSGFTLGFELGVQIPLIVGSTLDISPGVAIDDSVLQVVKTTSTYKDLVSAGETAGKKIGSLVLPYITLLRLGWMF